MLKVNRKASRSLRSYLHRTLSESRKLYCLSPAQCGCALWRFAVVYHGAFVLIGKGVSNRDTARAVAVERFGIRDSEYRKASRRAA